jgi:hypothetical protein
MSWMAGKKNVTRGRRTGGNFKRKRNREKI